MVKHAGHNLVLALTFLALSVPAGRAFAQSATTTSTGSAVTLSSVAGTDSEPQDVTGTDPEPQDVTGTDPEPQDVTGTDPEPQSMVDMMILQIIQ